MVEVIGINYRIEMLKNKGERLVGRNFGLLGDALQAPIGVIGHRDGKTAGEAEAFGHQQSFGLGLGAKAGVTGHSLAPFLSRRYHDARKIA